MPRTGGRRTTLGIDIADLRRAILGHGDVSSFAELYRRALGGSPVPVADGFDVPLRVPSPETTVEYAYGDLAAALLSETEAFDDREAFRSDTDLRVLPSDAVMADKSAGLARAIAESRPDVVAVACAPSDLAARVLYSFSLPCAVGLRAQLEIVHNGSLAPQFDGFCRPDGAVETAIIESWLKRVPVLAAGRPPSRGKREHDADSLYLSSRLLDICSRAGLLGRAVRVLAVVPSRYLNGVEQLSASIRKKTALSGYMNAESDPWLEGALVMGGCFEETDECDSDGSDGPSLAGRVFQSLFVDTVMAMDSETVQAAEATGAVAAIAGRLRRHTEVVRGPSVRGTIAFREVLSGLSVLNGGTTRASIGKAALIALPPRILARRRGQEISLVADVVKEVLYGVRLSGNGEAGPGEATSHESLDEAIDCPEDLARVPGQAKDDNAQTGSYAVVPDRRPGTESAKHITGKGLSHSDQRDIYSAVRRAVMMAMGDLEDKLRAGEISDGEYEGRKAGLMSRLKNAFSSQMRLSDGEMATTIMEMMDAQDKGWNREISPSRMQVYYHTKGTCERSDTGPFKEDYHALRWLIEDLNRQGIVKSAVEKPAFLLTGFALDSLLKYLTGGDGGMLTRDNAGPGGAFSFCRSQETRRYSPGDTFRDVSVRHTLKEVVRRKKALSEISHGDLRVFLKERREPKADVVICMDTSGSMGFGQKLTWARLAAAGLAKSALEKGDRAGVVAFNDYGQTVLPLTDGDSGPLLDGIAGLFAGGNTNIGDGLKSARELLLKGASRNRKYIVLITDGRASAVSQAAATELGAGIERDLTEESALMETNKAAAAGVKLSVIYVAPVEETVDMFIRNIARNGGGKVHRIAGPADLKTVIHCPSQN